MQLVSPLRVIVGAAAHQMLQVMPESMCTCTALKCQQILCTETPVGLHPLLVMPLDQLTMLLV